MAEAVPRHFAADPADSTHYATERAMAEWLAAAGAGQRMCYATGPALDPRAGPVLLAARWIGAGKVLPLKERRDGVLRHLLEKRVFGDGRTPAQDDRDERGLAEPDERSFETRPWGAPQDERVSAVMLDPGSDAGRIYRLLSRCANLGLVCPSNEQLAQMLDLPGHRMIDRQGVAHRMRELVRRGLIRFPDGTDGKPLNGAPGHRSVENRKRRVRIVASGKVTA